MQTCNRYNDYFNCAEHCAGYHASASDDLPAYMYAEDSSSSELVNPWDAPAVPRDDEVPLRFVPSGVAAWQPVAVTAYSDRLEELQNQNQNHGLATLEMEYPAMMGTDFDLEFPAMPMAAQDVAYEYENPAMPPIAYTREHQYENALELELAPLLPPGLGLEAQYYGHAAAPLHGLAASAWTPTPTDRARVDARLVARGTPPRVTLPIVPARVAGLGFALSDLLELRLRETALREYRAALELELDLELEGESDETSTGSSSSGFEQEELDELMRMEMEMEMEMEREMEMEMELDDEYVYYTVKDGVQEDA